MKWWPTLKCPLCGGVLPNREVKLNPLFGRVLPNTNGQVIKLNYPVVTCPTCSQPLQFARWEQALDGLIALGLAVVLSLLLGIRGLWLVGAAVVLWFPMVVIWEAILGRIMPPHFEAYVPKEIPKLSLSLKPGFTFLDISTKEGEGRRQGDSKTADGRKGDSRLEAKVPKQHCPSK